MIRPVYPIPNFKLKKKHHVKTFYYLRKVQECQQNCKYLYSYFLSQACREPYPIDCNCKPTCSESI